MNISLAFISLPYFKVPNYMQLIATHYFIILIPNKRELQQIASYHSSDIQFKHFMRFYKDYTKEPFSFFGNKRTLLSDNSIGFTKNLL